MSEMFASATRPVPENTAITLQRNRGLHETLPSNTHDDMHSPCNALRSGRHGAQYAVTRVPVQGTVNQEHEPISNVAILMIV